MNTIKTLIATLTLVGCASAMAALVELAGVKFDETVVVGNSRLHLNGAGIRYKAVFKVMAAGLYVKKKTSSAEEIFADGGPKRMTLTLLHDVEAKKFSKEFIRGFGQNANKSEMSRLIPGLLRVGQMLDAHGRFLAGQSITVDWIPDKGAVLSIQGKTQGEPFKEPEFFNSLLAMWIGKSPADWGLREALLGKSGADADPDTAVARN